MKGPFELGDDPSRVCDAGDDYKCVCEAEADDWRADDANNDAQARTRAEVICDALNLWYYTRKASHTA